MPHILITGHTSFHNRGNEALIRSTAATLVDCIPGARFTIFSQTPEYDRLGMERANPDGLDVRFLPLRFNPAVYYRKGRIWYALQKRFGIDLRSFLRVDDATYKALKDCDMLVVSGGDLLAGYGLPAMRLHAHLALAASALGKPTVIYAHSFNPYKVDDELEFARTLLNHASLVTVREKISLNYLAEIGIQSPVHLAADPAFWLTTAPATRIDQILLAEQIPTDRPLVGISASAGMAWYTEGVFEKYIQSSANLADYLVQRYGANIVFISHVIGPKQLGGDDRLAAREVYQRMKAPEHACMIKGEYNALELKGLIGRCQLFIGSRMHATVAAMSQLVPTIGLAYSIKAHGVLGELIQSRPIVFDVPSLEINSLYQAADDLFNNHEAVAQEIASNLPRIKEQALVTPRQAAKLLTPGALKRQ